MARPSGGTGYTAAPLTRFPSLLEDSLREEQQMASWVGDHIESVTQQFTSKASATA